MSEFIKHDHQDDGVDRRGFLKCMAWAGTGVLWTLSGGHAASTVLADAERADAAAATADFSFVQISDSHVGFHKGANKNVIATFEQAVGQSGLTGLGLLGAEQLAWIKKDLAPLSADTPLVIFSHVPLLAVYPKWGWGTADSMPVLSLVKRFGSVTALNGHIHQIITKREGNMVMHTAASTAYPLHAPGNVAPTPLVLPAGKLPSRIGIRTVQFARGSSSLALVDRSLA